MLPLIFRSNVPRKIKVEAVYHLTANLSYPLMIVMSVLLLPAMICRFYQGWFQMCCSSTCLSSLHRSASIAVFYLMVERELFPKSWWKTFLYLPFPDGALGIGLTVTNTKAVMEALLGIKSAFVRTPKYRVAKKGEKSQAAKYRSTARPVDRADYWLLLLSCDPLYLRQPELFHRAVFDSLRHGLLVYRADEPAARALR